MPETPSGRSLLLVALAFPAGLGLTVLATGDGPLLPQSWTDEFYVAKGLIGLVAAVLVVVHMSHTWGFVDSTAQRLRYLCLLAFVWLVASASVAQQSEGAVVAGRNVAGFVLCVFTVAAMMVSIRHDRRRP